MINAVGVSLALVLVVSLVCISIGSAWAAAIIANLGVFAAATLLLGQNFSRFRGKTQEWLEHLKA